MRAILIAVALAMPTLAMSAERVARQGSDEVRVFDTPCVSAETIGRIPENLRQGWNKAIGTFGGQRFFGCWRPVDGSVFILWEDGDKGIIPADALKPVSEV